MIRALLCRKEGLCKIGTHLLFILGLVFLMILYKHVLFSFDRIIITGDYISYAPSVYIIKFKSLWNPFERLGIFNYDAIYYSPLIRIYAFVLYLIFNSYYAGNIFFITPIFISYIGMYYFVTNFYRKFFHLSNTQPNTHMLNDILVHALMVASSLYYSLNPWITNRLLSGHLYLAYTYSFLPLLMKKWYDCLIRPKFKDIIAFVLLFAISINDIRCLSIIILILTITKLLVKFKATKTDLLKTKVVWNNHVKYIFKNILIVFLVLALLAPWFIAQYYALQLRFFIHKNVVGVAPTYPWLLKNINIINIMVLRSYWWDSYVQLIYNLDPISRSIEVVIYAGFLTSPLILTMIYYKKSRYILRYLLIFYTMYIIFIMLVLLLTTLEKQPDIVKGNSFSIVESFKYLEILYRDPDKLLMPLPFMYSIFIFITMSLISVKKSLTNTIFMFMLLIIIVFFLYRYTALYPLLHNSYPLPVVEIPQERKILYFHSKLKNNVLILPTDQYLVYKWINIKQPFGDINKYLLPYTMWGPPLDPTYEYTNISSKLIELQNRIYHGRLTKSSCRDIVQLFKALNIKTIVVQRDVYSYNYRVRAFLEFLTLKCNIPLKRLYPQDFEIHINISSTFYKINNKFIVNMCINGKCSSIALKTKQISDIVNSLKEATLNIFNTSWVIVSKCFILKGNKTINVDAYDKVYGNYLINSTLVINVKPNYISILNKLHYLLKIDTKKLSMHLYLTPDEKIILALYFNRKWHTLIFNLPAPTIEAYELGIKSNIFSIQPLFAAKINDVSTLDPTLYKIKIQAFQRPFILQFHLGYSPYWIAYVYADKQLLSKVKSIPILDLINGFYINVTGNLTIVIRYVPQDWFELGLKVSATTFALCAFYLVWDWRRNRSDR